MKLTPRGNPSEPIGEVKTETALVQNPRRRLRQNTARPQKEGNVRHHDRLEGKNGADAVSYLGHSIRRVHGARQALLRLFRRESLRMGKNVPAYP
jgi:hypothetical protein